MEEELYRALMIERYGDQADLAAERRTKPLPSPSQGGPDTPEAQKARRDALAGPTKRRKRRG